MIHVIHPVPTVAQEEIFNINGVGFAIGPARGLSRRVFFRELFTDGKKRLGPRPFGRGERHAGLLEYLLVVIQDPHGGGVLWHGEEMPVRAKAVHHALVIRLEVELILSGVGSQVFQYISQVQVDEIIHFHKKNIRGVIRRHFSGNFLLIFIIGRGFQLYFHAGVLFFNVMKGGIEDLDQHRIRQKVRDPDHLLVLVRPAPHRHRRQ